MLIEFRVENHRSIRDEQALTLEEGRVGEPSDNRPRKVEGHETRLLTAAALYGANGSGKSNVLSALGFMRDAVILSHRMWAPDGGVPRDAFAWGAKATEPSTYEVSILVNGVRYEYGFVVDDERVLEEWLYAWPLGRKQVWFERDADEFKFGENLSGENQVIKRMTRPNSLFLSASAQSAHPQLTTIFRWFSAMKTLNVKSRKRRIMEPPVERWVQDLIELENRQLSLFEVESSAPSATVDRETSRYSRLASFRDLLHAADIGILDFKVDSADSPDSRTSWSRLRVLVLHQTDHAEAWLPLEQESEGTLTLFKVGPRMLNALWRGGIVVVDELESSLHPLLALQIIRLFTDPATNPKNAQIIFSTHDTNLLGTVVGEPPLRRDQVWFTEKDKEGATVLYPLTDYKPRKSENLERGYLQGRYGAIPYLGRLSRIEG